MKKNDIKYIAYEDYYINNLRIFDVLKNESHYRQCILKEESEPYVIEIQKDIKNKHDKLFKDLFGDKESIAKFINNFIKFPIKISKDNIEKYSTEFITSKYSTKEADIVYRMKEKNIFFLIEHQSTVDRTMPYRIALYSMMIMEEALDREKMRKTNYKFPRVVPIVLYTGKRKWNVPNRLEDVQEKIEGYSKKEKEYNLIDINKYSEKELLNDDLIISKAMLIEKSKNKEELIENIDKIANITLKNNNVELSSYFIEIIEKYILPNTIKEESRKRIEKIKLRIGEKETMLNCIRMIEEENKKLIKRGRKEGIKEMIKKMIETDIDIEKIKQITGMSREEILKIKNDSI